MIWGYHHLRKHPYVWTGWKKTPIFRFPGSWVPYGYLSSLVESAPGSGPQTCPIWVSWWYWIKIHAKVNQIIKMDSSCLFSRKQGIHALHLWRKLSQEAPKFTFTKAWTSSLNNTQIWGKDLGRPIFGRQFGVCILLLFPAAMFIFHQTLCKASIYTLWGHSRSCLLPGLAFVISMSNNWTPRDLPFCDSCCLILMEVYSSLHFYMVGAEEKAT